MEMYGGVKEYLYALLTSALDGAEWSASRPGRLNLSECAFGTHWLETWLILALGVEAVMKREICATAGNQTSILPSSSS
jgi:hypothetical protein